MYSTVEYYTFILKTIWTNIIIIQHPQILFFFFGNEKLEFRFFAVLLFIILKKTIEFPALKNNLIRNTIPEN